MKIKKMALLLTLVGAIGTTPLVANAANHDYNFTFKNTSITSETAKYEKTDNDQKWYLSIDDTWLSTMSSSNIFGCKMHRVGNDSVDVYHTFSNYVKGYGINYADTVSKGDEMYLRAKKDSASTSTKKLYVTGRFAP